MHQTPADAAPEIVTNDPWQELKQFTDARISLGRCGSSLPLGESLSFKLAHARARDAVLSPFKIDWLEKELRKTGLPCLRLRSAVADRSEYLTRPDKGRLLHADSIALLEAQQVPPGGYDLCLVVSDGLSSRAIHENAPEFVALFVRVMQQTKLALAPLCLVENGRVAVADEIAFRLQAGLSAILIGERPGLSSPNSLGVYMTYAPKPGCTDESRNCISNIRPGGLSVRAGVQKLAYLAETAFQLRTSGVLLKDKMAAGYLPFGQSWEAIEQGG